MRKKLRAKQTRKKDKHQVHCVGFHSAKRTHTQTDQAIRKKTKKHLAAEHRAVRQIKRNKRKKTQ